MHKHVYIEQISQPIALNFLRNYLFYQFAYQLTYNHLKYSVITDHLVLYILYSKG